MTRLVDGGSYGLVMSNQLAGTLPTELGQLVQMMDEMVCSDNRFTGTLPTELGNLDQMTSAMV